MRFFFVLFLRESALSYGMKSSLVGREFQYFFILIEQLTWAPIHFHPKAFSGGAEDDQFIFCDELELGSME